MAIDLTSKIASVYRGFRMAGLPTSGDHQPPKPDIITLLSGMAGATQAVMDGLIVGGAVFKDTRPNLYADLAHAANKVGIVWGDPTEAYNGLYVKSGSSGAGAWAKNRDYVLPASIFAELAELRTRGAITVNAVGSLAERSQYDLENDGFVFVDASGAAPAAYILHKGVWDGPFAIVGEPGKTIQLDPTFETIASMTLAFPANTAARVIKDPLGNVTNGNGYWIKSGASGAGSWAWKAPLTYQAAILQFDDGSKIENAVNDAAWSVEDAAGNQVIRIQDSDFQAQWAGSSARFGWLAELDRQNVARAAALQSRRHNVRLEPLSATYQGVMIYGQSLGVGQEGWPALSTTTIPNTFMIGDSERGFGSSWDVLGPVQFRPLVATVNLDVAPWTVLTQPEIAALSEGAQNYGESPLTGAVRGIARAWDQVGHWPERRWVAMNTAQSGNPWEKLVPGASPNFFNRNEDAIEHFVALANTAGESKAIGAVLFEGGQHNLRDDSGVTIEADVLMSMNTIRDSLNSYITAQTGQALAPGYFVTQPGGDFYVRDQGTPPNGGLTAQLKFVRDNPGVWMVGPDYYTPDKSGHLTANGYRWLAEQKAKVMKHVLLDERDWAPTQPIWTLLVNNVLYVGFHAPALPLQFRLPYERGELSTPANRGLRVTDTGGTVGLKREPYLVGASIIAVELGRPLSGAAHLWTGSWSGGSRGRTSICDSDGTLSDEVYEYVSPPMPAAENIAALVGKPYPLNNWCVLGRWPITTTPNVVSPLELA